ncbi:MAG: cytochrome C oxidase subunit II, partial [Longimicrobiales bacterium]
MSSPLRSPDGDWWSVPVHGQEKAWLWLVGVTCIILFAWMVGWMLVGEQNPTGPTLRTSPEDFRAKVAAYLEESERTDQGTVPAGTEIFVGGVQFAWDGFPVVLEAGTEYQLHLSSYDVQHGFSIRYEDELWKQVNLQAVPGYEWIVPMEFEEPGTY